MRWKDCSAPGIRQPTLVPRRVRALLCVSAILCLLAVSGSPAWSAKEKRQPPQPVGPAGAELQTLIMRFADQVVFATITAFDQVRTRLDTPEKLFVAFERQQVMASSAYLIATEADPDTALLDMIVLVTLERMAAERYWLPEHFGEAGQPYLDALQRLEESIWVLGNRVMTQPQTEELQTIVADWEKNPPDFFRTASYFRLGRISARRVRAVGEGENRTRGLFASVRRAAEIADDVKLQVERLIFYLQRMPLVVEALAEVQVRRMGQQPEFTGSLDNLDSVADSLSRVAKLADRVEPTVERLEMLLPGDPDRMGLALAAGDERLHDLLAEVRTTAEVLNGTLEAAHRLTEASELPARSLEALESGEIRTALVEVSRALERLEAVVAGAERLLDSKGLAEAAPQLGAALDRVSGAGESLIDSAFIAGVKLIVVLLVGLLLTLLAYRYLSRMI